jgi:hypothetical protein
MVRKNMQKEIGGKEMAGKNEREKTSGKEHAEGKGGKEAAGKNWR